MFNNKVDDNLVSHIPVDYVLNEMVIEKIESKFCFYNDNLMLPFKFALIANYTIQDIADILGIDHQEVFNQLNTMIKESGYKLFN